MDSDLAIFESIDSKDELINHMNQRECSDQFVKRFSRDEQEYLYNISQKWQVALCKLEPAEIYLKLIQQVPIIKCNTVKTTDTWSHFDNYVKHLAIKKKKEIMGLESQEFQLKEINKVIASDNQKKDRLKIKKLIKDLSSHKNTEAMCALINDYRRLDLDYNFLESCKNEPSLAGRNASWMEVLPKTLLTERCLVTVGLLHLMKECGIITQLRALGFEITPVKIL